MKVPGRKREEIVRFARRLARGGYVVGTGGNMSQRRDAGSMWITPAGTRYEVMAARDICAVKLDGSGGVGSRSSEWRLHAGVYSARPDVRAIVHAHPVHACALAARRQALPAILDEVGPILGGPVEVAEYSPPGGAALAAAAVTALGDRHAILLANHGTLTVGRDLAEAFDRLEVLERVAHVYLVSRLGGDPVVLDG